MKLIYSRPILRDLSQGSRIAFARQFRFKTQDNLAEYLQVGGKCRRRTVTRYETGERNPEKNRTHKIATYLNISYHAIKRYDYKEPLDIIYFLLWLDELFANYHLDLRDVKDLDNQTLKIIKKFLIELDSMRLKRKKKEIKYIDYIEWKLNYSLGDEHEWNS